MMRILRKTMPSTAGSVPVHRYDVADDDLSSWEFVNASQSDDEDLYSYDGEDDVSSDGGGVAAAAAIEPDSEPVLEEDGAARDLVTPNDVVSLQRLSVSPPMMTFPVEMTRDHAGDANDDDYHDQDDDDDVDLDDVDDELVPWKLKGRFGKQRIRKMGKKGGPNFNKSKRLPYYYNRPGCVYGKHGFGVQHSFV